MERLQALLHNFPPHQSIPSGICIHPGSAPLQFCDVIYFYDLVIPLSCVKVQRYSVTKMDWAVNLPHRSPQTHSLCHWYPAAEIASFPPFPHEHWQVKGLDKSYISLSFQISHREGVLPCLSLSRSLLALFSMSTKSIVNGAALHQGLQHILQINTMYLGRGGVWRGLRINSVKL